MKKILLLSSLIPISTNVLAQNYENNPIDRIIIHATPIIITFIVFFTISLIVFLITFFKYRIKREQYLMLTKCVENGQPVPQTLINRNVQPKARLTPATILLIIAFLISIIFTIISIMGVMIDSNVWITLVIIFVVGDVATLTTLIYQSNKSKVQTKQPQIEEKNIAQK